MALGGRRLVKKSNNQQLLAETMEGIMESERRWGGAYGGVLSLRVGRQIEQHKKYKKIRRGLRWPCYNISHTTTSQKHVGGTREMWGKRNDQTGDVWGGVIPLFWRQIRGNRLKR